MGRLLQGRGNSTNESLGQEGTGCEQELDEGQCGWSTERVRWGCDEAGEIEKVMCRAKMMLLTFIPRATLTIVGLFILRAIQTLSIKFTFDVLIISVTCILTALVHIFSIHISYQPSFQKL